jgi:RHS repeat-associated protein
VTDGGGNETFHYLYGVNVDAVIAQDTPTGMVWSLSDRLGTVDTLTDASGVVVDKRTFDSFGRVLSQTNPLVSFRYGYTGRERDLESGLEYYRARYYDAANGVFISVDPIGFAAGDTNLYRYVGNNSTNYTDPSGEIAFLAPLVPWAIGAAVTGVTWALGGAVFGGVKESALSIAENIDRRESIDWGRALAKGGEGAISGAITGFGLGVVSTIPYVGQAAVAGFMAKGIWDSTRKFGNHVREGEWAQAFVEAADVGFGVHNGRGPLNKGMAEVTHAGKALSKALPEWGLSQRPQLAFDGVGSGRQQGNSTEPIGWNHFFAMKENGGENTKMSWGDYLPNGAKIVKETTVDLKNPKWRETIKYSDSKNSVVYVLRDAITNEILKPGKTEAKEKTYVGRFGKYTKGANYTGRTLKLETVEVKISGKAEAVENRLEINWKQKMKSFLGIILSKDLGVKVQVFLEYKIVD